MELMAVHGYGGNMFGFYGAKRKYIYMTINELATGFGYKSKKGIEKLIQRNPYLLDPEYSVLTTLPVRDYGTDVLTSTINRNGTPHSVGYHKAKQQYQEVRVFTKRGILEIGCISKTKEARQFRDWLYTYIEKLEKAFTRGVIAHTESKDLQKMLHDAVYHAPAYVDKDNTSKAKALINFNKLLIKIASKGRTAHKKEMTAEEIQQLEHLEHKTITLLNEGHDYQYIKSVL
ncbi:hypothetical protein [Veillonella agrestimuris]|uniref:hypothetical protein n=1 Tax=Veillonella agrestimuris TaxID=2941340 RepID=UPI00203EFD7E|nr:hypothetical protein [Veillonella agrestimuris]